MYLYLRVCGVLTSERRGVEGEGGRVIVGRSRVEEE